jgi:hypothetical protein
MDASICVERLRNWSSSIHPGHLDFASPPRKTFQKVHPREAPMTMLRMLPAFLVAAFALAGSPQGDIELMTQKKVLDFKPAW